MVVCSVVVADEIKGDEISCLLFLMGYWNFVNCFLLCRNGVAVVYSVIVEDKILSDKVNQVFSHGLLEFLNCFLLCRNGVTVVFIVVVADEIIIDKLNQVLFLMGYWNL